MFVTATAFFFMIMMVVAAATAGTTFSLIMVMMFVIVATAAAFFFMIVMMVSAATTGATFFLIMVMMFMIVATAAAFFVMIVVMMTAATAGTTVFPIMMMVFVVVTTAAAAFVFVITAAAATAAFVMMVMMAATASAAARVRTGQRHRHEGFVRHGAVKPHAFQHLTEGVVVDHGKAVVRFRDSDAARDEGVHRFLHQFMVTRHMHHLVFTRSDDVHGALFVNEHIVHFERTHVAQRVFVDNPVDRQFRRRLHSVGVRQHHLLRTREEGLSGTRFQRQKLRDLHFRNPRPLFRRKGTENKESRPNLSGGGSFDFSKCGYAARTASRASESRSTATTSSPSIGVFGALALGMTALPNPNFAASFKRS